MSDARAATAHHEAGHAVAAFWLKRGLHSVSIVPDDDSLGRVDRGTLVRNWEGDLKRPSSRQRRAFDDHITIALAGPHAQERFLGHFGTDERVAASSDYLQAVEMVPVLELGSAAQEEAYLNWLNIRARDLVVGRWDVIAGLAAVLLEGR